MPPAQRGPQGPWCFPLNLRAQEGWPVSPPPPQEHLPDLEFCIPCKEKPEASQNLIQDLWLPLTMVLRMAQP